MYKKSNKKFFIDLFAGCGGLSLGLLNAGFEGVLAIEKCDAAFSTLKENLIGTKSSGLGTPLFNWPTNEIPAKSFTTQEFIDQHHSWIIRNRGKIDLLAGGPPCQGFSMAGPRNPHDLRNELYKTQIELAKQLEPKIVLIENVAGIHSTIKANSHSELIEVAERSYADLIAQELKGIGYNTVQQGIILASDFGVPQARPRFFTLAFLDMPNTARHRNIFDLLLIKRKTFLAKKGLRTLHPISISEAISDMETRGRLLVDCVDPSSRKGFRELAGIEPKSAFQKLMHKNINGEKPNSMRLANHRETTRLKFEELIANCRHGKHLTLDEKSARGINKHMLTILDSRLPSPTLTTLPDDVLHYSEPRILTPREYARVQSFPDWFKFIGPFTTGGKARVLSCPRYTQIGNAVPPLVAEIIGEALLEILET
jgi:DNA (cytosine-5)-methyltransferase 1